MLLATVIVSAQDKFEVASIKVAAPPTAADLLLGGRRGGPGTDSPTQVVWRATPLGPLIRQAHGLKYQQLIAPKWVQETVTEDVRYDIAATLPPGTTKAQFDAMVGNLMEDRFGLKFHKETREITAYTLTVAKGGSKLTPAANPDLSPVVGGGSRPEGGNRFVSRSGPMSAIADMLEFALSRTEVAFVVDKTGLAGKYDFEIYYAGPLDKVDSGLPALATALEQDLGLKLEKGKTQVDVLVVDQINKVPTEN
jgi:uncharacterized protein (TIGR03435 family)